MNRKLLYNCSSRNLSFGILTLCAAITFIVQIHNAFLVIIGGGVLTNIEYTIFALKISMTLDAHSFVYNIFNYPLIPIIVGIAYNICNIIQSHKNKDKVE